MNNWISRDEKFPNDGQKVEIKVWDRKTKKYYEIPCVFIDREDYRSWEFMMPVGTDIIAKPEYWREI